MDDQTGGIRVQPTPSLSDLPIFSDKNIGYVKDVIAPRLAKIHGLDREDVEQNVWLRLCQRVSMLNDVEHPKSWIYTTANRQSLNIKRDSKLETESTEPLEMEDGRSKEDAPGWRTNAWQSSWTDNPEELLLYKERRSELCGKARRLLAPLPLKERQIVVLDMIGIPAKRIIELLGVPSATVYRLRKKTSVIIKKIAQEYELDLADDPSLIAYLHDVVGTSLLEEYGPDGLGSLLSK